MRDWTKTLYPASFRGVPFWIRHDTQDIGRRLDVVEIPGAETPLIEDVGAKHQTIEVSGYMIGDASDAQMAALEAACNQVGAGVLVMPAQGPLTARCEHIKRDRHRDEMGKIVFEAHFVLDPRSSFALSSAALPADFLAQRAFDANDALKSALTGLIGRLQA